MSSGRRSERNGGVLALVAKQPVAGQVKTRLCPPFTPEQAAAFYEAMLLDVIDQHADDTAERALWYAPEGAHDWFAAHAPAYELHLQRGASLSERMAAVFRTHGAAGPRPIVLRGTDSPTLPQARVEEAFALLASADLVLCPDLDGGYSLIGLREPHDSLFALQMSHSDVLEATRARAAVLGLRVALLEPHHDVDVVADLARLVCDLDPLRTPRTAAWLAGLRERIEA
jgi:uncharacterized protein